ncbi:MAG: ABC transporter substrate-binding protein [Desulfovibrio sp.]|nr:ABC transporter substrate-binding protein [Desulfovibrio sp.]
MKNLCLLAPLCLLLLAAAAQAAPPTVRSAWLGEYEAFPAWYARHNHWDTAAGIELEMRAFPSGRYIIDNIASLRWDVAGMGAAPAVLGMLRDQAYVIGVGTDEAAANGIYVRPDSPLPAALRHEPSPREYARLVTGKVVLCPRGTSAHQLLLLWLNRIGLNEDSISLVDSSAEDAVTSLANGVGDMAVLWAPHGYAAERAGLRLLLTGRDAGLGQPTLLLARKSFAEENGAEVGAFLGCYLRAVEALRALPAERAAALYRDFQRDFCGREISEGEALREVETHALYDAARQKSLLGSGAGPGTWLEDILAFHERTGELSRGQTRALRQLPLMRGDFLPDSPAP